MSSVVIRGYSSFVEKGIDNLKRQRTLEDLQKAINWSCDCCWKSHRAFKCRCDTCGIDRFYESQKKVFAEIVNK